MFAGIGRALAALLLLSIAAAGSAAAAPALQQVPAAFHGDDVFLQVSLNGAAPVWLQFDANVNESRLAASHLSGGTRQAARVAARMTVRLGAIALPAVFFDLSKEAAAASPRGMIVVGRLGRDSFGDRMLIIRTREHQVWLSSPVDTGASPADGIRTASYEPPSAPAASAAP